MIELDLRAFLLADSAIAALVGSRIYPHFIPQGGAVPAIVYQRIVTARDYSLEGQRELARPRIQLSCWDTTLHGAKAIADAVRSRVSGYIGAMGSGSSHGIYVRNEMHDSEPETGRYRALLDLEVWHAEPVTT